MLDEKKVKLGFTILQIENKTLLAASYANLEGAITSNAQCKKGKLGLTILQLSLFSSISLSHYYMPRKRELLDLYFWKCTILLGTVHKLGLFCSSWRTDTYFLC